MGQSTSEFCSTAHAQTIAKLNKSDMDWPLQKCLDMVCTCTAPIFVYLLKKTQVSEINLFIIGMESDVRRAASLTLSQTNRFIVWPEVSQVYVCILVLY